MDNGHVGLAAKMPKYVLQTLFLINMGTDILKCFRPVTGLPSYKDTGIRIVATHKASRSVKHVLEKRSDKISAKKRKLYTIFSVIDRTEIGQYISKHGYCSFTKETSQFT